MKFIEITKYYEGEGFFILSFEEKPLGEIVFNRLMEVWKVI